MLSDADAQLVADTANFLEKYYARERHHVACGLRCGDNTYFSLHLDSTGFDVCAEPIALSNALQAEEATFDTLVAVAWNGDPTSQPQVVTPCGDCRQILVDYIPGVKIIVPELPGLKLVPLAKLLPYPYRRLGQPSI